MTAFNKRIEERSYLLPQRLTSAFKILKIISEEHIVTVEQLMETTKFSRAYALGCCLGLKRYGVLISKRGSNGGYSLARKADEISVGEVMEALSKKEDRGEAMAATHHFIIEEAKKITVGEILNGKN